VKPLDFSLLTDENIAPDVVEGLRARGCDLRTAREERLIGRPDIEVLERATSQGRVVVIGSSAPFSFGSLTSGR
jgi:predicted nuclease of predicted toxin-antitoxin system